MALIRSDFTSSPPTPVRFSPLRADRPPGIPASAVAASERLARQALWAALAVVSALSVANFNNGVVPGGAGNLQQVVALGLWGVVIAATMFVRPVLAVSFGTDFYAIVVFYAFATLSVAWSDHSAATFMKAAALSITTFATYRVATRLRAADFLDAVSAGFIVVAAISVALALFVPQIGLDQTFMHLGQWQGVFESKQSLGTLGAFLMFFAYHRLQTRGGWLRFVVVFGLAVACVVGAESRGGAAVAFVACLSLSLPRSLVGVTKALAFGPLLITMVALVAITYLVASGNSFIPVFGTDVDFTERGVIWQYALSHFGDRPLLGFGLNGFWSPDTLHGFEREHGWALDNYHDGYVGILVETGLVGMTLFAASMLLCGIKLRSLITARAMPRADYTVIVGFLNLIFFIDLTETFFLRSTNINSIVLVTFLFMTCRKPDVVEPAVRQGTRPANRRPARLAV